MAGFKQKLDLLRGLRDGEKAFTGPLYVDVDVTTRCNLSCLGCLYHSPEVKDDPRTDPVRADISPPLARGLFEELRSMGTNTVILQGGGEPLLYPGIFDMISSGKESGFDMMMLTNGTLLGREVVEALTGSGLDRLRVSLWSSSREQYCKNYPGNDPDLFRKIIEGLKLLVKMRDGRGSRTPRVLLYHPINNTNCTTLDRFVDLGLEIPVDGFNFAPMNAVRDALAHFALTEDERYSVVSTLKTLRRRLDRLSLDHNIEEALLRYSLGEKWWKGMPCYAAWFHTRFRIDGETQPCGRCDPSLSMGNFSEKPFREIWNGPGFRAFRRETMSLPKMASVRRSCDCDYCCYVKDISRIHRVLRWLPPFRSQPSRAGQGKSIPLEYPVLLTKFPIKTPMISWIG